MDPGDTDVEQPVDGIAHDLGRYAGFLGDRQIGRTCRCDQNRTVARPHFLLPEADRARNGLKARLWHDLPDRCERLLISARHEQRVPSIDDFCRNRSDLRRRLA